MLEESVGSDFLSVIQEPSNSFRIYILFLIVVCAATSVKLIRIWLPAPPFRLSRQSKNPDYLKLLRISAHSLSHWMGITFLGWAIASSTAVYTVCSGLLLEKATGWAVIQFVIRDFAMAFGMALWVVLFIFLVRWHVSARIERLRD